MSTSWDDEVQRLNRQTVWGFTIYRIVYTEESNSQVDAAVEVLRRYFTWEVTANYGDATSQEILNNFRLDIIQDREQFDGASEDELRAHFRTNMPIPVYDDPDYVPGGNKPPPAPEPADWDLMPKQNGVIVSWRVRDRCFIKLDQDTLALIVSAPEDPAEMFALRRQGLRELDQKFRVKVVDALHDPSNPPQINLILMLRPGASQQPPYPGWIWVSLNHLWRFSSQMQLEDGHHMASSVKTWDTAWTEVR